ncbi:MAG: hypothetical protein L0H79_06935 [Intrasporangium sp.]|uniref:LPD29 domain-containing protein n=1 Tax=Intrasporangium sp. TaxID=1925024 RepID=UPI00264A30E2|nr:LPD29 domain-containing protein [Intrasporangium sp.]MDN5795473.1 hypothetical protein [Intrasporangium sp.]
MTTLTWITTKDTAPLLRAALRAAFPGVNFSVRMNRGSSHGWLNVSWADGPTYSVVGELCSRYEGSRFDGMDDGYHSVPSSLVAFAGEELPREVRFSCRGVATTRTIGPAGWAAVIEILNDAQPGVARLRSDGQGLEPGRLSVETTQKLDLEQCVDDVAYAAVRIHSQIDFTH